MRTFHHVETWVFDLDNTLYRFGDEFIDICNRAAAETAIELGLDLTFEEAHALATRSYIETATSFGAFKALGLEYTTPGRARSPPPTSAAIDAE